MQKKIEHLKLCSNQELRDALNLNREWAHSHPEDAEACLAYCRKINAEIRRRIKALTR